ncbi:MAG: hypothetical protein KDC92_16460 [Bacteroidetes bacterium]|nr:hypothetical protein [Bacteroidota bacterium]
MAKFPTYKSIVGLLVVTLFLLSGCAEEVCPANSRQIQHMQLTKINAKRKRDKGLFPKSMENVQPRKKKKKEPANTTTDLEEDL